MRRGVVLLLLAFGPMLLESGRSRRNERSLRAEGAVEPADDVYRVMQVAYPGCFLAMLGESWARRAAPRSLPVAGATLFMVSKALKYWAVATLGPRWTYRVLVVPGVPRIARGPYRFLRHPNYAGVAGELAGIAMIARAPVTGVLSLLVFGWLMLARIRVEERAMERCER